MGGLQSKVENKINLNVDKITNSCCLHPDSLRIYKTFTAEESVPPHPGPEWTRFVLISDTHSRDEIEVPDGDILIHAGDLSSRGYSASFVPIADWLCSLKHEKKIVVAGNHDICLDPANIDRKHFFHNITEQDVDQTRELFLGSKATEAGVIYLQHEPLLLELPNGRTWKIFGSPYSPRYGNGAFQYKRDHNTKALWKKIPNDTEILITHTPAHGVLDKTIRGDTLHVFGHIHEAAGHCALPNVNNIATAVNAATTFRTAPIYVVDLRK